MAKLLLDNCVNHRFAQHIRGAEVVHVRDLGWEALTNGNLLQSAEDAGFDVLLTVDKSIRKQQNLQHRKINLITLAAFSILLEDLLPFIDAVAMVLADLESSGKTGEEVLVSLNS